MTELHDMSLQYMLKQTREDERSKCHAQLEAAEKMAKALRYLKGKVDLPGDGTVLREALTSWEDAKGNQP